MPCSETIVNGPDGSFQVASAQVLLAKRLDSGHESIALVACGEILPAPLPDNHNAKQFQQAWDNRQQIDRVENAFDQDLGNDHSGENANNLADAPCLAPVDLVESFVHLAEDVFVALGEGDVVACGAFSRLRSGFVAHDA